MSRLIQSRIGRAAALTATLALGVLPPAIPALGASVVVRPTGAPLTAEMVEAVASAAPSVRLTVEQYPEAGNLSIRDVIQSLCGRVTPEYLALLKSKTGLSDEEIVRYPNSRVYEIEFPSCLYISGYDPSRRYVVQQGDNYSKIRERFTGVQGNDASNARFFSVPIGVVRARKLAIGDAVKIPYFTAATPLTDHEALGLLEAIAPPKGKATGDYVSADAAPVGRIVTYTSTVDGAPETPSDCATLGSAPFDAKAVADAFIWSRDRSIALNQRFPNNVDVMVADNGFFGAQPKTGGGYDFRSPEFDRRYFDTGSFGRNLGPSIGEGASRTYPVNFQNGFTADDALSGHGTHVTGLVLGGEGFLDERARVFGDQGVGWLKIIEMNLGRGSSTLLTGSNKELALQLVLMTTPRIVNLSISYDGAANDVPLSFSFMDESKDIRRAQHLFVVAAGNDKGRSAALYQPAARGGLNVGTVITVAALNSAGRLASFTNIGSGAVDVAAPGCSIASWTGFSGSATPLSGTSQATPLVTFELVLIKALTGASAAELKLRAVVSGDLLHPDDAKKVGSHMKINPGRSVYVFDDYVRWKVDGVERAVLGQVVKIKGLGCDGDVALSLENLGGYKTDGVNAYLFERPKDTAQLKPCEAAAPGDTDVVVVEPWFEADTTRAPSPEAAKTGVARRVTIPLKAVEDITMRLQNVG